MMRIAHILSSFGMGGQERVALDLAVGQRALGHQVMAVSLAPAPDGPLAEEFHGAGVEVSRQAKRGGFDPTMPVRLGRLFRRMAIDVVHTHNPQPLIYAAPAARATRAALVHTKHGMNPDASSGGWARSRRRWLRRTAAGMVDAFVAVSEHTAGVARDAGEFPRGPVEVIPNGIDLSRFFPDAEARAAVRDELGIPQDAYVVGTVGRLFREKGHDFLLRAVEPLLSPRFHLVLVGDGPRAEALAEIVRGLSGAASVHLLGARRDVPRLVAALDTFVLSSVREGLPLGRRHRCGRHPEGGRARPHRLPSPPRRRRRAPAEAGRA